MVAHTGFLTTARRLVAARPVDVGRTGDNAVVAELTADEPAADELATDELATGTD